MPPSEGIKSKNPNFVADAGDVLLVNGDLQIQLSIDVDQNAREELWQIVQGGFVELNAKSFEKQDMTREEFDADMKSERVRKYLALDDGAFVGFLTVHRGVEDVTWADQKMLSAQQEALDPEGESLYIGTLVVPANLRGGQIASSLLRATLLDLHAHNETTGHQSIVFFDCAGANYPGIPEFASRISKPTHEFRGIPVEITEIAASAWVKGDQPPYDAKKIDESEVKEGQEILDTQHFFAMKESR